MNVKESLSNFPIREETHNCPTRSNYLLELNPVRLEKTKKQSHYMKVKLFNKLPEKVCSVPLKNFESLVKQLLKETVFYSVEII